jgi:hypothetical protein
MQIRAELHIFTSPSAYLDAYRIYVVEKHRENCTVVYVWYSGDLFVFHSGSSFKNLHSRLHYIVVLLKV